ncbi:MAG: DUF2341 domain-containing protein, partial [Bacteroidia bacterium]|nr:DUF2341 domain-containing protein [Bacteroidia bacterium]MDW8158969.1 DUF2341 domain-containing protein [Bacteroidia bacterium]
MGAQPLTSFSFQIPITINNVGNPARTNWQVPITVNTSTPIGLGQMQPAGQDIRFVDQNCSSTFLDYWIESGINTPNTLIWVKVPFIPANSTITIYMLYGNPNAAATQCFACVFSSFLIATNNQVFTSNINVDWFEIPAGVNTFVPNGQVLTVNARAIRIAGFINGNGRGYSGSKVLPATNGVGPSLGVGGGIAPPQVQPGRSGGGGAYGGIGGCQPNYPPLPLSCGGAALPYGTATGLDIDMGAGGATGSGAILAPPNTNQGGNGGGAVHLEANSIIISGKISMNGENGGAEDQNTDGGGGGAGGGILLRARHTMVLVGAQLIARGGKPANTRAGGGSGGRVKIFYDSAIPTGYTVNVSGADSFLIPTPNILPATPAQRGGNGTLAVLSNPAQEPLATPGTPQANFIPGTPTVNNVQRCGTGTVVFSAFMGAPAGNAMRLYTLPSGGAAIATATTGPSYQLLSSVISTTTMFYVAAVNSPTCFESSRVPVVATVIPAPGIPSALNVSRCNAGFVTFTVQMGVPAGDVIRIFDAPVGGNLLVTDGLSPYELTIPTPVSATTTFYVESFNSSLNCSSDRIQVVATVNQSPVAPTPPNPAPARCGPGPVVLNPIVTQGDQVRIYDAPLPGGNLIGTATSPFTFTVNIATNTSYYVSSFQTITGCESTTRTLIAASVLPVPATPNVANITICAGSGGTATFTVNMGAPAGNEARIYTLPSGTDAPIATDNTFPYTLVVPANATTTYYVSAANTTPGSGNCESPRIPVTVSIEPVPGAPIAFNASRCGAGQVTITAIMGFPAGTTIRLWNLPVGGVIIDSDNTPPNYELTTNVLAPGNYTFFVDNFNSVSGCASSRVPVSVSVFTIPQNPTATNPPPRCGPGIINFNGTLGFGGQSARLWDAPAGGNLLGASTGPSYSFSVSVNTTTTYYLAAVDNSTNCSSNRVPVTFTVNPVPGDPTANNVARCGVGNVTFSASMGIPSGSVINLYTQPVSGSPVVASATAAPFNLTPAPPPGVTTTYYMQAVLGTGSNACVSNYVPVIATINEIPSAPVVINSLPITICAGTQATITAAFGSVPGTEIRMYNAPAPGGALLGTATSSPYTITTPVLNQNTTFHLEAFNANTGCSSVFGLVNRTPVQINVVANPAPPSLGASNQSICGSGSTVIQGITAVGATGVRLFDSPTGGSPLAIATGTPPWSLNTSVISATTIFYVESFDGVSGCSSTVRTPITITVNPLPGPPSAANVSRCGQGTVTFTVNMGSPPGTTVRLWTLPAPPPAPAVETPIASDPSFPYSLTVPSPPAPLQGNTNFYIDVFNSSTGCSSPTRIMVSAFINPVPTAPVVPNVERCGIGPVVFTATMGAVPGNQVQLLDNLNNLLVVDNSPPYELTVNINANTQFQFRVVNTVTGCVSASTIANGNVNPNPNPDPPSAAPVSRCGPGVLTFSAQMGNIPGTQIRVYSQVTDATPIDVLTGPQYLFTTPLIVTTTTYYIESITINPNSTCPSTRVPIVATINPNPGNPTSLDLTRCGPGTLTFTANMGNPLGNEMRFYDVPVGGSPLTTDNIAPYEFTTPTITATTTYYVESVNTVLNCISQRIPIVASVNPLPGPPGTVNVSRCGPGPVTIYASMGVPPGDVIKAFDLPLGGTEVTSDNTPPYELNVSLLATNTTYYLEVQNSQTGCNSTQGAPRTPVIITIQQVPSPPATVSNVFRCLPGSSSFTVNMGLIPGDQVRLYLSPTGGSAIATDNVQPYNLQTPFITQTTTFYIAVANSLTGCESSRIPAVAFIDPPPSAPTTFDVSRCGPGPVTFSGTLGAILGDQIRLYDVPTGGSPLATDVIANPYTITTPPISTTTVFYIAVANLVLGCEGPRTPVTATINPIPAMPSSQDEARCGPGPVNFFVGMGAPLGDEIRLYNTPIGGTVLSSDNTSPYVVPSPAITTSQLFYISSYDSKTGCESPRLSVTAIIEEALGPPNVADVIRCGTGPVTFTVTMGFPAGNAMKLYKDQIGGAPILTDFSAPYELLTPSITTTTTFYVASINTTNGCESSRIPVVAVINETPGIPSAANVARCGSGPVTITVLPGTPGGNQMNVFTSAISGALLGADNTPPYEIVVNVTTNSTFYAEAFNNVTQCASSRIPVIVTVNTPPGPPTANSVTICGNGKAVFSASFSAPSGNQMVLYSVPLGGTMLDSKTLPPYTLTTPLIGATTQFYIAARNTITGCESNRTPVTATVQQTPGNPIVTNQSRCGAGVVTFTGAMGVPAGNQMRLYDSDIGGNTVAFDNLSPFELTTPVVTSTTTFYMTAVETSTGCESERIPVVVTVSDAPGPPLAINTPRCGEGTVIFSPNMGSPAGTVMRLYDSPVGGTLIDTDNTIPYSLTTTVIANSTVFYIAAADASTNCESIRTPALAIVNPKPQPPVVPAVSRCGSGPVVFTATASTGSEVRLYNVPAGGFPIATDNIAPLTLESPSIATTTNFFIDVFDGNTGCSSNRIQVTATINPLPALPTVANVTRCNPGLVTFTAEMNIPAGDVVNLYQTATGGFPIDTDNAPPYNLTTPSLTTTTTFYISTRISSTGCESSRLMVTAEISPIPGNPIVQDAQRCGTGVVTFTVQPGAPPGNVMRLFNDPIPGSGTPIATDNTVPYELTTPLPLTVNGVFYVESFNSLTGCASQRVAVNAIINPVPAAPGAASVQRCGPGSVEFEGIMNAPAGNRMLLYSTSVGGAPLAVKDNFPFKLVSPPVNSTQTFFIASAIASTGCESPRTPVDAIINPAPGMPSVADVSRCGSGVVTFSGAMTIPAGNQMNLYTVSSGGAPIATDAVAPYELTTPPVGNTTTFYISSFNTVSNCESARKMVVANINDIPGLPIIADVSRCGNGPVTFTANVSVPTGNQILLYSTAVGGSPISSANTAPYFLTTNSLVVTTTFYAAVANTFTGCVSERLPITAIVNSLPGQPIASDVSRCGSGSVTFIASMGSPEGSEMRLYESPTASAPIQTDNSSPYELATPVINATTTFYISSVSSGTGCESARTAVTATIFPAPGTPNSQDVSRCGPGSVTFTATPTFPVGNRMRLFNSPTGTTPIAVDDVAPYELTTPSLVGTSTFYIEMFNTGTGCASQRQQVVAVVNPIPGTPTVENVSRCGQGSVIVTASMTPPIGSGIRLFDSQIAGTLLDTDRSFPFNLVTPSIGTNTTVFAETFSDITGCVSPRVPVTITINQVPAAPIVQDEARCGPGSVTFTAIMGNPAGNEIRLYATEGSSTPIVKASTSPYTLVTPEINATTAFSISSVITSTGCESPRTTVNAIINPVPGIPSPPNTVTARCGNGIVTFVAFMGSPAGNQLRLYQDQTSSVFISSDNNPPYELSTGILTTTTTFYIASVFTSSGCESPRIAVTAQVNPIPGSPVAPTVSRCGSGVVTFTASMTSPFGTELRLWDAAAGGSLISTDNQPPYELTTPSIGITSNFFLESVNTTTNCSSLRVPVTAIVNSVPGQPIAADESRCGPGPVTFVVSPGSPPGNEMRLYASVTDNIPLFVDNSIPFELVSPSISSTTTYYIESVNINTGCASPRTAVTATVNPAIGAPIVESVSRCEAGPVTFTALMGSPVGNQMRLYNVVVGGTPLATDNSSPYTLTTPSIAGSATFFVESVNTITGCVSQRTPVLAVVNSSPGAPLVSDVSRCGPGTVEFTALMDVPVGNQMLLYSSQFGGSPIAIDNVQPYNLTTPRISATTTFYVAAVNTVTTCESNRTPVTAIVNTLPAPPIAADALRCGNGQVTFNVSMGTPAGNQMNLYFEQTGGSPVSTDANPPYELTTPVLTSTTVFFIESENTITGCKSNRTQVQARVSPSPGSPTIVRAERCGPGIVEIIANMSVPAGDQMRLYNQPTGSTPIATVNSNPFILNTPFIVSTTTFYLASANQSSGCESPRTPVAATVNVVPGAPIVNDVSRCGPGPVTFTATMTLPVGNVVVLYDSEFGGTPLTQDATSPFTLPVDLTTTNQYYVSVLNTVTGCESNRVLATATANPLPPAPVAENVSRCGTGIVTFYPQSNAGGTTMRLYNEPIGGQAIATDQTPPFELTISTPINTNTLFYLEAQNTLTQCISPRTPVLAIINSIPGAPLAQNQARCGIGSVTFTMSLGTPAGNEIRVYSQGIGGLPIANFASAPFEFTTLPLATTTTFFIESVNTNTSCASSRTPIVATINPIPGSPAVSSVSRCGPGAVVFTATMVQPVGNQMKLYDSEVGGTPLATASFSPYTLRTPDNQTTTVYYISNVNTATGCESIRTPATATINPIPGRVFAQNVSRCGPGPVVISASMGNPPGTEIRLYDQPTGGVALAADNSLPYELTTPFINSNSTIYVGAVNTLSNCESPRTQVLITIQSLPGAPSVSDVTRCGTGVVTFTATMGSPSGNQIRLFTQATGGAPLVTDNNPPYEITSPVINTNTTFFIESFSTETGCGSNRTSVNAVVNPIPTISSISSDSPKCVGDILNLTATGTAGATYIWSGPNGFNAIGPNPSRVLTSTMDAGTYSVIAILNNCTSVVGITQVFVNPVPPRPEASFYNVFGENRPLCVGDELNLRINNFSEFPVGTTFIWNGPNSFTATTPFPVRQSITTSEEGDYYVRAVVNGCVSPSSQPVPVVVNKLPTPPIATNNGPLCVGQARINLFASNVPDVTSYQWTGPNGFSTTGQNVSRPVELINAGTYSVTVTSTAGCTSLPATTVVTINPKPGRPNVTSNAPVCAGQTLVITATGIPGASYVVRGPGNFLVTGNGPTFSRSNMGLGEAGIYSVTAILNGCPSDSSTINVVVNSRPTIPQALTNSPICVGQVLRLSSTGGVNTLYSWSGPGGYTVSGSGPEFIKPGITLADAGVYTLVSIVNGCTSLPATANVIVNPIPARPVASSDSPKCERGTLTLSATGEPNAIFVWTGPDNFNVSGAGPNFTRSNLSLTHAGLYSVRTVIEGCTSQTATVRVEVNPLPAQPLAFNDGPKCVGTELNLTAIGPSGVEYMWVGPNGYMAMGANAVRNLTSLQDGGVYSVSAILGSCTSDFGTTNVEVLNSPTTPNVVTDSPKCVGETLTLTVDAQAGATYMWSGPNGFNLIGNGPVFRRSNLSLFDAGYYSVTAMIGNCTSAAAVATVLVNPIPSAPTASSNAPVCVGETLTLNALGPVNSTYRWTGPNGFISTQQSPSRSISSTSDGGNYSVVAILAGCTSVSVSVPVVVNRVPNAPFALNNGPRCVGETIVLTATGEPGVNFIWTGPNSFAATGNSPTRRANSVFDAGTYYVRAVVAGCTSAQAGTTVVVNPIPNGPSAGSNGPLCEGQTLNLTASQIPNAIYFWTGPNGFTSNQQQPTIPNATVANAGTYNVTAIVNGCTSLTSGSVNVAIRRRPPAPSASSNSPICSGQTLNLSATSVPGATYVWTGQGDFTSQLQNPTRTNTTVAMSGFYTVIAIIQSCTSEPASVIVEINQTPDVPSVQSNSPLCAGETLQLSATVSGNISTFAWTGPNGFFASEPNPTRSNVSVAESGIYNVIAILNNCSSRVAITNVTVNPKPEPPSVNNNGPVCEGRTLQLNASTVPGATYTWTGPGGFSSSLQSPVINNVKLEDAGLYFVRTSVGNCSSNVVTTNVIVNRAVTNLVASSNSPVCSGQTINLIASSAPDALYSWRGPGGFNSTEQNPRILNAMQINSGTYSVTATIGNCVSEVATVTVVVNPGVTQTISATNNGPLCAGRQLQLNATLVPGATYTWTGP